MGETHALPKVAYFCMEYGLDESFPIYAGGLGILAGDHMKSAHDLEVPLVGVGILWQEGYTTQRIGPDGRPYDTPAEYRADFLQDTGVRVSVNIRGEEIPIRVWLCDAFGNAPLYLLDTNIPGSNGAWITRRLYVGEPQDRIAQEMVLGIGGVRALRALGLNPQVFHFNEGHAVFAGIELMREKMQGQGMDFKQACQTTYRQCVFTTHTPVLAGNEAHDHGLLRHMGAYLHLNYDQMRTIGDDPFNMTIAGLRLSYTANGVSKLHGTTARRMWVDVDRSSPINDITNGVHRGTWQDPEIREAFRANRELWGPHMEAKRELIGEIHSRTGILLDADVLLIGFARRAAPYKRSHLIFSRPEIIEPLLESRQLQLVFSGKAHPQDGGGQDIVTTLVSMARRYPQSVVFLENYDIRLGRVLTRGCDIWLNNPQRPLEASGTSGMKAAMNGVLNLSILDGWWPEGCRHGVTGWQVGHATEDPNRAEEDLISLYDVLLDDVLPTYYEDREKWVRMMRESIRMSQSRFSSERMVMEYYNLMYQPAAEASLELYAGAHV